MSWETVKGFCRRRTQAVKERVSNAPHTVDADLDRSTEAFVALRGAASTAAQKMRLLEGHLTAASVLVGEISELCMAGEPSEETRVFAEKLRGFRTETASKTHSLSATFHSVIAELDKFKNEAEQLEVLKESRKDKMLEYDFFRNKLEELRAHPPSDTSRIPRNEQRMEDWRMRYTDATNRLHNFIRSSRIGGETAMLHTAVAVCNEYGRYLEDVAKTARSVLTVDVSRTMSNAVRQVVDSSSAAMSSALSAGAAAAAAVVPAAATDTPFTRTSSDSNFVRTTSRASTLRANTQQDDPFKL